VKADPRMVTIDGPAGTGKSVTARALAERLGLVYLDSGALYRAIALAAEAAGIAGPDDERMAAFLRELPVEASTEGGTFRVQIGERDVSAELRDQQLGQRASRFATDQAVRDRVGEVLRRAAGELPSVAEGRDMGSTVFPDADLRIYLTASLEERARRRTRQLRVRGQEADERSVSREIAERDFRDRTREASPLRQPPGAIRLDTTQLALEEQIDLIISLYRGRGRLRGTRFYRAVRYLARVILGGILGARLEGEERIPKGAYLAAGNHQSYLDPPLLGCLLPGAVGFMAKEELFSVPILGSVIRRLQAIPVRRGAIDRRALRESLALLGRAVPLVIFPQGTRVRDASARPPHAGVAWLARRGHVPVTPVRIESGGLLASLIRRRPIRVVCGPPLEYGPEETHDGDRRFAGAVMDAIERLGENLG